MAAVADLPGARLLEVHVVSSCALRRRLRAARTAVRRGFVAFGAVAMWPMPTVDNTKWRGRDVDAEQDAESALSVVCSCVAWSFVPNGSRRKFQAISISGF